MKIDRQAQLKMTESELRQELKERANKYAAAMQAMGALGPQAMAQPQQSGLVSAEVAAGIGSSGSSSRILIPPKLVQPNPAADEITRSNSAPFDVVSPQNLCDAHGDQTPVRRDMGKEDRRADAGGECTLDMLQANSC